jgi:16S rRNA (cytosine1407-C5)-methyltransferase
MRSEGEGLPGEFLERLRRIIPASQWDPVVQTFATARPTTYRANTLKATGQQVQEALAAQGLRVEPVSWCPGAFILTEGRLRELQETQAYREGWLYVQSLSSLVPVLILDPQPGEQVLDLTAAPGSKTTQIACLMREQGRLVANDNNRIRLFKLKANLALQGATEVEVWRLDGERVGRLHPERFDRVLLDAPCSAEGRFQTGEPKTFRYWKPAKIREMVHKQRRLLASGIAALKAGGVLVYSTCTFAPEENEGVIAWALKRFGDAVSVDEIRAPVPTAQPGLSGWGHVVFAPSLANTVRLLPTPLMEGFFLAKLRKLAANGRG